MKTAVILYLRVSSVEQLQGSSIETQEKICTDYALKNGYEIDKIFTERGESAKTADRTALQAMLEYVGKNHKHLAAVIVYKIDRLARNTLDHAELKIFFIRYGIKLISATEHFEDTPVGRLIENQLAGFAQFDNEIRAERSKNGMIAAVKAGRYVWKAPLGFINVGGRGTSNLALGDPETVRLIRKAWEYIDTGNSLEEARKAVTKAGLKGIGGKPISKSQFHRMIKNSVYMGIIQKFGLTVVGNFPPIVEAELSQRVQAKLNNKAKNVPIYKKDHGDFPLRGLITCGGCGKRLTASWSRGRNGKFGYYRCVHCKKVNYKRADVESTFIQFLKDHSYRTDLKNMLMKAIEANLEHRNEANKKKTAEIERELLKLKAKEKQIAEKNFKNVLSDSLAKQLLVENEEEKAKLMLELHGYQDDPGEILQVVSYSLTLLTDMSGVWLKADLDIKKRFQKLLFPQGLPYDGRKFGTAKLALCIERKWMGHPKTLYDLRHR